MLHSKESLVTLLKEDQQVLTKPLVEEAFRKVDRIDFVPKVYEGDAYGDYPLPIGHKQTISQPSVVAFMLELLDPRPGEKILDVGSGSGWTVALLATIVGEHGWVWGVERIPELVQFSEHNIAKYNFQNMRIEQAGPELGLPRHAPFDKILVSAAGRSISEELLAQLKPGGYMVIPVNDSIIKVVKKIDGTTTEERYPGYVFVPLIEL